MGGWVLLLLFATAIPPPAAADETCECLDIISDFPAWNLFVYTGGLETFDVDVLGSMSICGDLAVSNYGVGESLCDDFDEAEECPYSAIGGSSSLRVCGNVVAENFLVYHGISEYVSVDPANEVAPEIMFLDGSLVVTPEECNDACEDDYQAVLDTANKLNTVASKGGCNVPPVVDGVIQLYPSTVPRHPAGYTLWCIQVILSYYISMRTPLISNKP